MNKKSFIISFLVCLFSVFISCNINTTPDIEKLLISGTSQAFHITYDANGGSGTMKKHFMAPGHSEQLKTNEYTAPNRYYFGYWNTEPDGTGTIYYEDDKLTMGSKNVTLYAIWLPTDTFVIQYYNLYDATNPNPATYTVADTIQLTAPVRNGYTFNGWYTDSSFYEQYLTSGWQRDTIDGTQKLYAHWSPITYSIYYDANNGTMPSSYTTSYTIESSNITLPTPTRTGYTFKGWLEQDATDAVYTLTTGSYGTKSYVAQWQINTYKVYYYSNDGNNRYETQDVVYNDPFVVNDNMFTVPIGYTFGGWGITTSAVSDEYSVGANLIMGAGDVTLYAIWNEKPAHNIYYSGLLSGASNPNPGTYREKDDFTLQDASATNAKFLGWYDSSASNANKVTGWSKGTKTYDITLYAKWETPTTLTTTGSNNTFAYIMGNVSLTYKFTVSTGSWSDSVTYYSGESPNDKQINGIPMQYLTNGREFKVTITATNPTYGTYSGSTTCEYRDGKLRISIPGTLTKQ